MSTRLPNVDLTGAAVGQKFTIPLDMKDLTLPGLTVQDLPTVQLLNESGVGLSWQTRTEGHSGNLPAGGWKNLDVVHGETAIDLVVQYVLPGPPVSMIMSTYYYSGETPDVIGVLGNSPIGIGGSVTTSSVQTLSNEGSAPTPILVIDIGNTTATQLITIYNDGSFVWSILVSGVTHQLMKGSTAKLLQLGLAGDIVETLGNALIDGTLTVTGDATFNGAGSSITTANDAAVGGSLKTNTIRDNSVGTDLIDLTSTNITLNKLLTAASTGITGPAAVNLILNAVTGFNIQFMVNNVEAGHIDGGGLAFTSKKLFDGSANNLADWSAGGQYIKGNPAIHGPFHYQSDGSHTDFSIGAISRGTFNTVNGTTGTIAHGLTENGAGVAPDVILAIAFTSAVSGTNATIGISEVNSTTFKASSIAAFPAAFFAFKLV